MGSEKASPQSVCATCTKPITPQAIVEYQHGSISHKACPVAVSSNGGASGRLFFPRTAARPAGPAVGISP
jgi:hypothetical protein